jgi:hypothetical protein
VDLSPNPQWDNYMGLTSSDVPDSTALFDDALIEEI